MHSYLLSLLILSNVILGFNHKETLFQNSDQDIAMMSFNLRYSTKADGINQWDNRKEACITMIKDKMPTVFGIQEGLHSQVTYLDEHLSNYKYVGIGRDDGKIAGEYAAIFYENKKLELVEHGNFWLSETPETPSLGWDANNIRITSWAKFKYLPLEKTIYVFNTHFDHMGQIAQAESSKLLNKRIVEIVDDASIPVFITGDFNLLIDDTSLASIRENYKSAQRYAEISDNIPSYNGWNKGDSNRNIDFIFYKNASVVSYETIAQDYGVPYISDHYPIMAYFNLY